MIHQCKLYLEKRGTNTARLWFLGNGIEMLEKIHSGAKSSRLDPKGY